MSRSGLAGQRGETVTSETRTNEKPDFSNYTCFPGANDQFSAVSVLVFEGRVYLGLKGYGKKLGGAGYVQAEFDYEQLKRSTRASAISWLRPSRRDAASGKVAFSCNHG